VVQRFSVREPDGSPKAIYSNIAMPATFDGSVIDYVDLDIDVIRCLTVASMCSIVMILNEIQ